MSIAKLVRVLVGSGGMLLTGGVVSVVESVLGVLVCLVLGFIVSAASAQYVFRKLATAEEIERSFEDRLRPSD